MDGITRPFLEWVSENFGAVGQAVIALLAIAVIFGIFLLVQNLPVSKDESLCGVCVYKNPNEKATVYCCPDYKRCRTLQLRPKKCPRAEAGEREKL
jgi:hypothetical protein